VFLAGFVITGGTAGLIYAGVGVISLYLGWSVLKLKELGRRLMIGWYGLTMVHAAYVSLVPGVRAAFADAQRAMPFQPPAATAIDVVPMTIVFVAFGVILGAVAIWFLVKERPRFS
jgi:hypothetical protein